MANETVYRIMNHAEVVTLKEMVMKNGKLTYEKLCRLQVLMPCDERFVEDS